MLDTACDLLAPELRPVAPQPNCPQSMKIYEDHRNVSSDHDNDDDDTNLCFQLAAEFVRMQTEMTELQQYKAQLAEQIKENQELVDKKAPSLEEEQQVNRLKEEKVGAGVMKCHSAVLNCVVIFRTHYWLSEKNSASNSQ